MEFIKKHYEKVILSVVLLGLAVAAFMLTVQVQNVTRGIEEQSQSRERKKGKNVREINLTTNQAALARLSQPLALNFSGEHNVVNPIPWVTNSRGGGLIPQSKSDKIGPAGLSLRAINPLWLVISFEGVAGTGDELRYQFGVEKQYAKKPNDRRRTIVSANVGAKTQDNTLILREVQGPKDNPTGLVCELIDGAERIVVTKEKPLMRALGYSADLYYEAEKKAFSGKRVDEQITLSGRSYKIVAIGQNEAVVSDPDTQKRYTASLKPASP
jgi:hypothetical protein